MTPDRMAALHKAAFEHDRAWTTAEFSDLLDTRFVQAFTHDHGFALTRTIAGESELLTLAVDPQHQRKGTAAGLMRRWLAELQGTAGTAFLEVAADNAPAQTLYAQFGFTHTATRKGYYARKETPAVDAFVYRLELAT